MRTSCPGTQDLGEHGGLTGRSPGSPVPSPERTTSSPLASTTVPGEVADAELRALEIGDQRERPAGARLGLADETSALARGPRACRARS